MCGTVDILKTCLNDNGYRPGCGKCCVCEQATIPNRFDRQPVEHYLGAEPSGQRRTTTQTGYAPSRQWNSSLNCGRNPPLDATSDYPPWPSVYTCLGSGGMMVPGNGFTTGCGLRCAHEMGDISTGSIDSRTIKTGMTPTGVRGFDGGKWKWSTSLRLSGHRRHALVDTTSLVVVVLVTSASVQDREGARLPLERLADFCKNCVSSGSDGACRGRLQEWVALRFRFRLLSVVRPESQTWGCSGPRPWHRRPDALRIGGKTRSKQVMEQTVDPTQPIASPLPPKGLPVPPFHGHLDCSMVFSSSAGPSH